MAKSKKKKSRQRARRQAARKQARPQVNGKANTVTSEQPVQTLADSSPAGSKKAERLEKREAARQSRIEAVRRRKQAERRKRMLISGVALVVVLGLVAFFVWRSQRNKAALATEARAAGCSSIETFDAQPGQHIDSQEAPARNPYNSEPPTSGDHMGGYNPVWGDVDETLEPEQYVHNLEHGGTVVHYKDLDDEELTVLQELADEWGAKDSLAIMPNPDIDKPVVLTAWAAMRTCERVSKVVIEGFIKERCNKDVPEKAAGCGSVA